MSHSGVPVVSQVAQLVSGAEGNSNNAPAPIQAPAAPTLAQTTEAANDETENEGQGQAADILTRGPVEDDPETASSVLLGS